MASVWGELKRRNVVKVAVAYAIVGWVLVEVSTTVLPVFEAPDWIPQVFTFFVILGFPLALILSWAYEMTPEGIKLDRNVAAGERIARVTGRKLDFAIIGALVLALVFVIYNDESEDAPAAGAEIVVDEVAEALPPDVVEEQRDVLPNSVAVLPFDNLSLDPENAFFAAGIHESTLNQLAKIRDLNVIARTSVMQYEEDPPPIPEIAEALRVEMVMEGSVRYANDRVLITAQLIDGRTGAHLWSDEYNRDLADIFAVQAEIARAIATALEAEFSASEQNDIERPLTESPEAYAFYLRALAAVGNLTNANTMADASADFHGYLDQAITLDPAFARAHALKAVDYATSLIRAARLTDELTVADKARLARQHADRALALDPTLGLAHDAHAQAYRFTWRWAEAEAAFERAVQLAPNDPQILYQFATFSLHVAQSERAVALARRHGELDPNTALSLLPYVLLVTGDLEGAIGACRDGIEVNPTDPELYGYLGLSEALRGNDEAALEALRLFDGLTQDTFVPPYILGGIAYAYSSVGNLENANRILSRIEEMGAEYRIGAGNWATLYLAVGDEEQVLDWLRMAAGSRIADAGFIDLAHIAKDIFSDPVLSQPEFVEARERLGFIDL